MLVECCCITKKLQGRVLFAGIDCRDAPASADETHRYCCLHPPTALVFGHQQLIALKLDHRSVKSGAYSCLTVHQLRIGLDRKD